MAKFRHIAISTEDPEKTAAWYKEVFGLVEVGRTGHGGYYLTDGDINFAILRIPSKDDPTKAQVGVSHFGFMVEDPEETCRKLEETGAKRLADLPVTNQFFEMKFVAPDGLGFDISIHGWPGTKPVESATAHSAAR